jgi:hypothetical protein
LHGRLVLSKVTDEVDQNDEPTNGLPGDIFRTKVQAEDFGDMYLELRTEIRFPDWASLFMSMANQNASQRTLGFPDASLSFLDPESLFV